MKSVQNDPRIRGAFANVAMVASERKGETHASPVDKLTSFNIAKDYGPYTIDIVVTYKHDAPAQNPESGNESAGIGS